MISGLHEPPATPPPSIGKYHFAPSYAQKLHPRISIAQPTARKWQAQGNSDLLKPIPHRIPHPRDPPAQIKPPQQPILPINLPRHRQARAVRPRHLRAALDHLRRRRHDETRQPADRAGCKHFPQRWIPPELRVWRAKQGEGAVVAVKEEGVQGALRDDWGCCACGCGCGGGLESAIGRTGE